ncbi:MAG: DUF1232 domain-containing protein [Candidatus Cloacimonetes bacterium]|nr:DUF1232 domain-containing protein [Candidatus Cloacimonadota bacterium]
MKEDDFVKSREMNEDEKERINDRIVDIDPPRMKFYEELREKIRRWTEKYGGRQGSKLSGYLLLLPDFFVLLCRLAMDDRVPRKTKILCGGIIAYIIMPIDLIPDFIPIIGMMDDLVMAVLGLNMVLNQIDKNILLENWSGEEDLLTMLQKITAMAESFVDKNILQKIKAWLKRKHV